MEKTKYLDVILINLIIHNIENKCIMFNSVRVPIYNVNILTDIYLTVIRLNIQIEHSHNDIVIHVCITINRKTLIKKKNELVAITKLFNRYLQCSLDCLN